MGDLITVEQVEAMPAGETIRLTSDTIITPAARDAAEARGIAIVEAERVPATSEVRSTVIPAPSAQLEGLGRNVGGCAPVGNPGHGSDGAAEQVIVTAVGRNRHGILSEITGTIAELNGNVMDINQRILQDYFTTIMIVDISGIAGDFATFKQTLESISRPEDYRVAVQHEKVFQYMHRV